MIILIALIITLVVGLQSQSETEVGVTVRVGKENVAETMVAADIPQSTTNIPKKQTLHLGILKVICIPSEEKEEEGEIIIIKPGVVTGLHSSYYISFVLFRCFLCFIKSPAITR